MYGKCLLKFICLNISLDVNESNVNDEGCSHFCNNTLLL